MIICAIDIETKDPNLKEKGSGEIRRDGYILGVGMYCPDRNIEGYYDYTDPIVKDTLADKDVLCVFHNAVYDTQWLVNWAGLHIANVDDTMTRETLLDTYRISYSLDTCCMYHGIVGKNKNDTIDAYWTGKGKAVQNLDKIPRNIVAKYCIQDCIATYELWHAQQPLLEAQELLGVNQLECALYPLLWQMKKTGIRVDWKYRDALSKEYNKRYVEGVTALERKYGITDLSFSKATHMEKIFRMENIPLQYTGTGRPSFNAQVLDSINHPVIDQITELKHLDKVLGTFLDGQLLDLEINGRIHPLFYPAKRDESGGTVTGRWSSQAPNMQNQPRTTEYRTLFIPEEDHILGAFDYKQIEYRVFAHFASGPGAEECKRRYNEVADVDYHQMTVDMMGWGPLGKPGRILAKSFNFGVLYGLGLPSFIERFRKNILEAHPEIDPRDADQLRYVAEQLRAEYFARVPFVKYTADNIQRTAKKRGYVRTVAGRRQRLPPDHKDYKLVNYLVQGSAADVLKKGMADALKGGVFNVLKPHLTVHDEVVFSIPKTKEGKEACEALKMFMENGYPLTVPVAVDTEVGPDWGHCDLDNYKEFMNA